MTDARLAGQIFEVAVLDVDPAAQLAGQIVEVAVTATPLVFPSSLRAEGGTLTVVGGTITASG